MDLRIKISLRALFRVDQIFTQRKQTTLPKTSITMGKQPFEDVFPMKHVVLQASHVSFRGCIAFYLEKKVIKHEHGSVG